MTSYENKNAEAVLEQVEKLIESIDGQWNRKYEIQDVYGKLSIFDWWNKYLSKTQLNDMRKFLKVAIKHGYTGYVCFKVGASGCANGMWAHKEESTDGYSPKGEFLYKSFTPDYNCWSVKSADGETYPNRDEGWDSVKTIKQLEAMLEEIDGKAEADGEITVTAEQVEMLKAALHDTYEARYDGEHDDIDEYLRGYGIALASVLDILGVEHEKWNPLARIA